MAKAERSPWERWLADLADPRKAFRITVFGHEHFTREWNMGRRVLSDHMLHVVASGGHQGEVAGRPVRTAAGSVLWVPAGTEQMLRQTAAPFAMYFLRFTLAGAMPPAGEPPVREHLLGAATLIAQLHAEHLGDRPGREARMRALLVQLFVEWWRASEAPATGLDVEQQHRLMAMVDANLARRWKPAGLARLLGLSPTWFTRRFRRSLGCAPRRWLMERRIRRAAALLVEDRRAIGAVAADLGYADLFLFSRQFSAVMGVSPRAWRARHGAP